ncbi:alpha-1,6-mannosylglycoprotein 6-beta-N-acetylglucosaminyltransferase B-like [Oscarella lobularis]|uniref:alpha-1,6-mannosylglycoprotein 6-beta-N-acetylglucosaminyltransferase B-like n=1 Tax=Oscarella lobularis TaxID=121494 RepID=UPI0033132FBA
MNRFARRIALVVITITIASTLIALLCEKAPVELLVDEELRLDNVRGSFKSIQSSSSPKDADTAAHSPAVARKIDVDIPTRAFFDAIAQSDDFRKQDHQLKWIKQRITRLSKLWEKARRAVFARRPSLFERPKRILIFPGLLSEYSAYDFATNAFKGGYLGELVQWSDLIAAVYALKHDVTVLTRKKMLESFIRKSDDIDIVYTDYIGLHVFRDLWIFPKLKCKFRIVDSFGTEPLFNFRTKNWSPDTWEMFSNWAFEDTRQYLTFFPHTPDNSFLGFVIELGSVDSAEKKNYGVIYGKEGRFFSGKENYLNTIRDTFELYATSKDTLSSSLRRIKNLGILTSEKLQDLLAKAKIFVGMGFPYDGPAPLEALAHGCVFLQPKFNPPRSAKNDEFFKGKPSSRSLSSQNQYLEKLVGEPYVISIDMKNVEETKAALQKIRDSPALQPFVPYEFTAEGFLERVGVYIQNQNFCDGVNLAEGKKASASSFLTGHRPGEAIDGKLDQDTCFWSEKKVSSWWEVDLGKIIKIRKIRVINMFDWYLAKSWKSAFIAPFKIRLLASNHSEATKRDFLDSRLFYVWTGIEKRARFLRLSSLNYNEPRYFVVCNVEVYPSLPEKRVIWPDPSLLVTHMSTIGESCTDTCSGHGLVCERSYFRLINSFAEILKYGNCKEKKSISGSLSYLLPAVSAESDTCYVNDDEPTLFSCAGSSSFVVNGQKANYKRLCPCRSYRKHQIALPVE